MDSLDVICLAINFNSLSVAGYLQQVGRYVPHVPCSCFEFLDFNLVSDAEFLHFHFHSIYQEIFSLFPHRHEKPFNYWAVTLAAVRYLSYLSLNTSLSDIFFLIINNYAIKILNY